MFLCAIPVVGKGEVALFAGNEEVGFRNGERLHSQFCFPYGIAIKNGYIILTDSYNNLIRQIDDINVSTIAGGSKITDAYGFSLGGYVDDEGKKARFNKPRGIAIDSRGNIYVADTKNHVIRKIVGEKVFTFAGTGEVGYANGKALVAKFNQPTGITIDNDDNLYITDTMNNVIRKITPQGDVTTYAGEYSLEGGFKDGPVNLAKFNEPTGIVWDAEMDIIVVDSGNQRIRRIFDDKVVTLAGTGNKIIEGTNYIEGGNKDGSSAEARFNFPKGIAIGDNGTIFVADTWNHSIRAITKEGLVITLAGTGYPGRNINTPESTQFNGPVDIIFHENKLYISDMWNNRILTMEVDEENLKAIRPLGKDDEIVVLFNENKIEFPDTQAYIEKGRTMVPLRFIVEAMGGKIYWNEQNGQVTINSLNGKEKFLVEPSSIVVKKNRTMVHIRYLAENLGCSVKWLPELNTVLIKES